MSTISSEMGRTAQSEMDYLALGLRMAPSWYVWGGMEPLHPDTITARWTRLRDGNPKAKPPVPKIDLRFHDIRHATASFMSSEGVGAAEGAARLGNTPEVFLGTYLHAAPAKDQPIADAIGARIDQALDVSGEA